MDHNWKPYRPRVIALINAIGRLLSLLGLRSSLNEDSLSAAARRKTGLTNFGDESFREALRVLAASADNEARLHPFGRWVIRNRLIGILVVRLQVQDLLGKHPEIAEQEIAAPLVIAGLQRTGTTMLHRLLAADPNLRALLSWEAINPIPSPKAKAGEPDPRIKAAVIAEKGLAYLAPDFFAIHPVEADAPEEDVLLLEYALLSQVPEATLWVPGYGRWLAQQDMTPAYEYLRTLLQVLQWQRGAQRWVLKTPAHLEHLDVLLRVFPGAKIIQTHRDPVRTTGSFSSMLAHGFGVFSDAVDPAQIARLWLDKNAAMVQRARVVRRQHPDAFIDVTYYDLMADPMAQVERIYAFAGLELSDAARAAMHASRQRNRKDKYGRHSYRLQDFGLSPEIVHEKFADYREFFAIPVETPQEESA